MSARLRRLTPIIFAFLSGALTAEAVIIGLRFQDWTIVTYLGVVAMMLLVASSAVIWERSTPPENETRSKKEK